MNYENEGKNFSSRKKRETLEKILLASPRPLKNGHV